MIRSYFAYVIFHFTDQNEQNDIRAIRGIIL